MASRPHPSYLTHYSIVVAAACYCCCCTPHTHTFLRCFSFCSSGFARLGFSPFPKTVSKPPSNYFEMSHSTSASGATSNGFLTPVVYSNETWWAINRNTQRKILNLQCLCLASGYPHRPQRFF